MYMIIITNVIDVFEDEGQVIDCIYKLYLNCRNTLRIFIGKMVRSYGGAIFGLMIGSLWVSMLHADQPAQNFEAKTYDFSKPDQMNDFLESTSMAGRYYTHSDSIGIGGKPGKLLSLNRGDEHQALHLGASIYDITSAPVSMSVKFQYREDDNAPQGEARILLVLSRGTSENFVTGRGKLGMRVYRQENPVDAERPWQFQLINSTATRNVGEPFAMEAGNWYELDGTFQATSDGKSIRFSINFRDFGADGVTPGLLRRSTDGGTITNAQYNIRRFMVGLLGQYSGSGAVAFDDLKISSPATKAAPAVLQPVTFLPRPLPSNANVPTETLFGVCGHVIHTSLFYEDKNDYWKLEYTLPYLLEANLGWVREAVYQPWFANRERRDVDRHRADLERYLEMYEESGVKVLLAILATPPNAQWAKYNEDFFHYMASLVERFECIRVVEMHNEPNLRFFWSGTPGEYVEVYRQAADIIKAKRPDITIAVGSISSLWWEPGVNWLNEMVAAGALEWADAISVHPYNTTNPPETDPHYTGAPAEAPNHRDLALDAWWAHIKSIKPEGKDLKVYFTEFGYSSVDEGIAGIGSEKLQADYLSRLMMIFLDARLRGIPVEGLFWYDLKDDGPLETLGEHNFGLIRYDLSRVKPAYSVYAGIAAHFKNHDDLKRVDLEFNSLNLPGVFKAYTWQLQPDGSLVVPFWRMEQMQKFDEDFTSILEIKVPDGFMVQKVNLHTLLNGHAKRSIGFSTENNILSVPVNVGRRISWLTIHPKTEVIKN